MGPAAGRETATRASATAVPSINAKTG